MQSGAAPTEVEADLDFVHSAMRLYASRSYSALDEELCQCLRAVQESSTSPPKYPFFSAVFISKKIPAAFALPKTKS
eukprot:scaffold57226_cov18-Prasinocladus_malaysianus.AAC.1